MELDSVERKDGAIEDAASCLCHVSRYGQMPRLNRYCVDLASSNQREEYDRYPPTDLYCSSRYRDRKNFFGYIVVACT